MLVYYRAKTAPFRHAVLPSVSASPDSPGNAKPQLGTPKFLELPFVGEHAAMRGFSKLP